MSNISDRKQIEEALRRSEATLKSVFATAPVGLALASFERQIRWVNEGLAAIAGYKPEDLEGKHARILYPSDEEFVRITDIVYGAVRQGRIGATDSKWIRTDGEIRDVHVSAAAADQDDPSAGVVFSVVDITDRKRTEAALRESEAKYRMVVESSLVGVYILQDGLMRFANKRWCEMYGYEPEEVIDRLNPLDAVHPDDRRLVQENIRKRLADEVDYIDYEFRALRKDGGVITVRVLGGGITYRGRPAVTGTVIDVSRERALESRLLQAQKMEAIGTLAGGVAHDFNNILTSLMGYASLLQMEMDNTDYRRSHVEHILSASKKAASLTQKLLAFSRQQPVSTRPVNLNDIIRSTEKLLRRLLTEDITLSTNLCQEEIVIMSDATQVDQILFNLATNARDAMPGGGNLVIETQAVILDKDFFRVHGTGRPGRYALLSVSDTGSGMDESIRMKMFDPFFTTKAVNKGTGLGLSTVYGIVKQHDGHIVAYSKPQAGTTIHIYIPVADGAVSPEVEKPMTEAVPGGKETILLAEDNETVRNLVKNILMRYGYTVIEAGDGQEAIDKFKAVGAGKIDLLLFDSVMPKMNGRVVYDELAKMAPKIKVLFMSGYTRDIVLDKGIEERRFAFVSKPVTPMQLLAKVREVLDK
ncbi:MAG: PAS domain S-box protein [Syntrophales bacterium]|nr:PAS domain S-box protein [Syntrophales bacterium]